MHEVTFIHAADLHLDGPYQSATNYDDKWKKKLRSATWNALENLIDLAIDNKVDFLLISGDIYNFECHSLRAEFRFWQIINRLAIHQIHAYIIYGNHDPVMDDQTMCSSVEGNKYVHVFASDQVESISHVRQGEEVARLYGRSFWKQEVCDDPALQFIDAAKNEEKNLLKIALLHGRVGERATHLPCASCSLEEISHSNIQYWAMGHVHKRKVHSDTIPCVVYPGSIQGTSLDELGAKGCYLVKWNHNQIVEMNFRSLQAVRWEQIEFQFDDVTESMTDMDTIIEALSMELQATWQKFKQPLICQLILKGSSQIYCEFNKQNIIRTLKQKLTNDHFVVIDINNQILPCIEIEQLQKRNPAITNYTSFLEEAKTNEELFGEIEKELSLLFGNDKFQSATGTKKDQRGKGQWKIKKMKKDWIIWLDEAKKIGIDEMLSFENRQGLQVGTIVQQFEHRRRFIFNPDHDSSQIMGLLESLNIIEVELHEIREKQNLNIENARKDDGVAEMNQVKSEKDHALLYAVKQWTKYTMAIWACKQVEKRHNAVLFSERIEDKLVFSLYPL